MNWQKSGPLNYGLEKLTLNFLTFRHNIENHTAQIFEPGHMETPEQYSIIAKKISDVYLDWKFEPLRPASWVWAAAAGHRRGWRGAPAGEAGKRRGCRGDPPNLPPV